MKKINIIVLVVAFWLAPKLIYAQEKISEFSTNRVSVGNDNVKMEVLFELYDNKLVLNYKDKKTIKSMQKNGMPNFMEFPYPFTKEENGGSVLYKYQDDILQIKVILTGIPMPSVSIKTKDGFTGEPGPKQLYYSM